MKRLFGLFRIKPEERIQAAVALTVIVALNALFVFRLHELFMQPGFGPYWNAFERELHLSGYDPYTYLAVTDWDILYETHRHPLLAFLVWPLWLLNQGLTALTGVNCVQYVVALPIIFCSLYSYIFLYRILREVVGLRQGDATLLTAFGFSLAYVLLSVIVPDHFTVSMFLLLLTFYISGMCFRKGRAFQWWQSAILFYITAGVTLSNGIMVFLSGIFVNKRDFFRPKYLLLAVILPLALLWATAVWQHEAIVQPRQEARENMKMIEDEKMEARVAQMSQEERARYEAKKARREAVLRLQASKTGKPMEDHGYLKWTDISTSRWETAYENLFGESLQFHRDYFLEDVLVRRPVFVSYHWWISYALEAVILLLFVVGAWMGRKSLFLWMCLSWLAFNIFLHVGLGFGINEIYIMTPHWAFVLPIATAYLFLHCRQRWLRLAVLLLTLYLFTYNGWLLTDFLLTPIKTIV